MDGGNAGFAGAKTGGPAGRQKCRFCRSKNRRTGGKMQIPAEKLISNNY